MGKKQFTQRCRPGLEMNKKIIKIVERGHGKKISDSMTESQERSQQQSMNGFDKMDEENSDFEKFENQQIEDDVLVKKFEEQELASHGFKQNMVLGRISSGKTSLLNYFYDLHEETGVSETTKHIRIVWQMKKKYCVWDYPGIKQSIKSSFETEHLFTANRLFFLFGESLISNQDDIIYLNQLREGRELYLVRTRCDAFDNIADLQLTAKKDRQLLCEWGLQEAPLFFTSVRMNMDFANNRDVKNLLDS